MTLTGSILIWMVGHGFDALNNSDFKSAPAYLVGFILLVTLLQSLRFINYYLLEWIQQRTIYSIRRDMYKHLLALEIPFRDKSATGDLLTRLSQDVVKVSELLIIMPAHLFSFSITIIFYLGILFYIDTSLTLFACLLIPLIFLHQKFFISKTRKAAQLFLNYQGRVGAFEEESLRNMQGIVTFSASPSMLDRFDKLFTFFRRAAMHNLLLNNGFIVSFELLIACAAILLVTLGIYSISINTLTAGGLINFLLYLSYLSVPIRGLANIPIESQIRAAAAERIAEILDEETTVINKTSSINVAEVSGKITFKNVNFNYPDKTRVFENLNLQIDAGEHVAIMGASGIGKSTFAKLLIRIYEPSHGSIFIDGRDLREMTIQSLRSHVSIVWQEPFFIDDTIFENLRLSNPDANEEQIRKALHASFAHEFIEQLPDAYNTRLGQGLQLSTGQKQRIAIAQALLRHSSILILDEATSALDSHSEAMIKKALKNLPANCTVIIIAHHISSITEVGRIIYFNKNGTITAGTHDELKNNHHEFQHTVINQDIFNAAT